MYVKFVKYSHNTIQSFHSGLIPFNLWNKSFNLTQHTHDFVDLMTRDISLGGQLKLKGLTMKVMKSLILKSMVKSFGTVNFFFLSQYRKFLIIFSHSYTCVHHQAPIWQNIESSPYCHIAPSPYWTDKKRGRRVVARDVTWDKVLILKILKI